MCVCVFVYVCVCVCVILVPLAKINTTKYNIYSCINLSGSLDSFHQRKVDDNPSAQKTQCHLPSYRTQVINSCRERLAQHVATNGKMCEYDGIHYI